jgi:hypothetical protein
VIDVESVAPEFALPEQANATNHNSGIDQCLSLIGNIPAFLSRFGEGATGVRTGRRELENATRTLSEISS